MPLRCDRPGLTQVLILGVAHLDSSAPDEALQHGLAVLQRWHPDRIAVERLPGHLVDEYERRGGAFADFPVGGAVEGRQGAATVEGSRPWNVWQARAVARDQDAPVADRVIGWLLAREPINGLLLPWRTVDLPPSTSPFLDQLKQSTSEHVRVGVRLARALGHSELVHFDDHAGVELLDHLPDLMAAVDRHYRIYAEDHPSPSPPPGSDRDAWLHWAWASQPETRQWSEEIEGLGMTRSGEGLLRARNAQWRTRNLAMATRLRDATALIPGGRLLAIVGDSHVRPLRAALSVDQHDLELTDITDLQDC